MPHSARLARALFCAASWLHSLSRFSLLLQNLFFPLVLRLLVIPQCMRCVSQAGDNPFLPVDVFSLSYMVPLCSPNRQHAFRGGGPMFAQRTRHRQRQDRIISPPRQSRQLSQPRQQSIAPRQVLLYSSSWAHFSRRPWPSPAGAPPGGDKERPYIPWMNPVNRGHLRFHIRDANTDISSLSCLPRFVSAVTAEIIGCSILFPSFTVTRTHRSDPLRHSAAGVEG